MNRLRCTRSIVLMALTISLTTGAPLRAADNKTDLPKWENLKQLTPGQEIKVVLNDAKAYRGRLEDVRDQEIKVSLATGNATFARQDILRVSTRAGSHRARNAGLGAAIGGGSLAGVAAAKGDSSGDFGTGGVAVMGLIGGAALGAIVGAVLPSEAWRDVYRAR